MPMMNVFRRDGDVSWHFSASRCWTHPTDPDQDPRHLGTVEPAWNLFDMMPHGGATNCDEQLDYDCCH